MKDIHISIQHILRDLTMIFGLLKGKTSESIFVDIYSNDGITLNASKDYVDRIAYTEKNVELKMITCQKELEHFLLEKDQISADLSEEPLTHFAIFDTLGAEMIQLKRFSFLLKWYQKLWILAINPVTLFLTSRWRMIFNLVCLYITYLAFQVIPENSLVQYFLGESSPLFNLIWLPYGVLLLFDMKYLAKLNLLMSEMSRRAQLSKFEPERKTIIVLSPCIQFDGEQFKKIKHISRALKAHIIHFTDSSEHNSVADMRFSIPRQKEEHLLKYMGVLSGHLEHMAKVLEFPETDKVHIQPIDARILEKFSESGMMQSYSPSTCYKLVLNYEYLSNRYDLNSDERYVMADILLKKFASDTKESSIGFNSVEADVDVEKVKNSIQAYL